MKWIHIQTTPGNAASFMYNSIELWLAITCQLDKKVRITCMNRSSNKILFDKFSENSKRLCEEFLDCFM